MGLANQCKPRTLASSVKLSCMQHCRLAMEANIQSGADTSKLTKDVCVSEGQLMADTLEHPGTASISPGISSILSRRLPKPCSASLTLNAQPIVCSCHCCFLEGDGLPLQPAVRSCQLGGGADCITCQGIMSKQPHLLAAYAQHHHIQHMTVSQRGPENVRNFIRPSLQADAQHLICWMTSCQASSMDATDRLLRLLPKSNHKRPTADNLTSSWSWSSPS